MDRPVRVLSMVGETDSEPTTSHPRFPDHHSLTETIVETPREVFVRLDGEYDCVLAPFDLPEMSREAFLDRLRDEDWRLPVVFYGENEARMYEEHETESGPEPVVDVVEKHLVDAVEGQIVDVVDARTQQDVLANRIENYAVARHRESQLQKEQLRYRTLFENFPEPTIAYSNEGGRLVLQSINQAFEETFGFDAQTAVGEPVVDLLVPVDETDELDEIAAEIAAGGNIDREVRRQTDSGSRTFLLRNIPVEAGQRIDGFAVYSDITDRKRREEKLLEREAELEQQKENLQQQKAQLEYQNERLDQFASIVSHDLRNPLNVAKGRLDIAKEKIDNDTPEAVDPDNVEKIETSLDRMETIIEDALTLARQGKAITDTTQVALGETAQEAWSNVDTARATLDCCRGVEIDSDRDRLLRIFENLFRNAVEHGGEEVTVRLGLLDGGFYVEDDGPGIDDSRKDDVLDRGFTTSREGTGFGLAIVEDVVRAHGWSLAVTDSSSGGARFEITDVEFSWEKADIVDVLGETLGYKKANDLVEDAMYRAAIDRPQFDRETAIELLDVITAREDLSSLVEVAAKTARKQIAS